MNAESSLARKTTPRAISAGVASLLRYGVPYALELDYVRGDGSIGWLEARADAERDASGNAVRLHGTAQDISGRKGNPAPS